jgi:hypothetical protein
LITIFGRAFFNGRFLLSNGKLSIIIRFKIKKYMKV